MGFSILLLGNGTRGYRVLQGLGKVTALKTIYIWDPNPERLARIKELASSDSDLSTKDLFFLHELGQLSDRPEAIVSCVTAQQQVDLFREIHRFFHFLPPNIILEQPISGGRSSLLEMASMVPNAFILAPRVHWSGYSQMNHELASFSQGENGFQFEFVGNMRGMGANGIHYLHLFRMLSGATHLKVTKSNLVESDHLLQGKWKEFEGEICLKADFKHDFRLVCTDIAGGSAIFDPPAIYVRDGNRTLFKIEETGNRFKRFENQGSSLGRIELSDTIKISIEGILKDGDPRLPKIKDSLIDHLALFDAFELALGPMDDFGIS